MVIYSKDVESERKGAEIKGKVVEKRKEEVVRKREGVMTRKRGSEEKN